MGIDHQLSYHCTQHHGLHHYWAIPSATKRLWENTWPWLVMDARIIVQAAGDRLQKTIDNEVIHLNGYEEPHEDFILTPAAMDDFCKTSRSNYDLSVSAILLRASQLAGEAIQVSSDGEWDEEWMEARKLLEKLWPIDTIGCPWADEDEEEEEEEEEEQQKVEHKCTVDGEKCSSEFSSGRELLEHIRLKHDPVYERPFSCPVPGCKEVLYRPEKAKNHLKIHLTGYLRHSAMQCTIDELASAMDAHDCWDAKRATTVLTRLRKWKLVYDEYVRVTGVRRARDEKMRQKDEAN